MQPVYGSTKIGAKCAIQNSIVCLSYNPRFMISTIINVHLLVADLLPFTRRLINSTLCVLKLDGNANSHYTIRR
jgi:hypothetical protein